MYTINEIPVPVHVEFAPYRVAGAPAWAVALLPFGRMAAVAITMDPLGLCVAIR